MVSPFHHCLGGDNYYLIRVIGMLKNQCKINVVAALVNLCMVPYQLLSRTKIRVLVCLFEVQMGLVG